MTAFDTVRRRHYCGGVKSMGLDRVDNARGYTTDNVVPACTVCNLMKKDMPPEEFVKRQLGHRHEGCTFARASFHVN